MAVRVGGRNDVLLPAGETSLCPRRAFGFRGRSFFCVVMSETAELRLEVPRADLAVLDGYCSASGRSRSDVVRELLSKWSSDKSHEAQTIMNVLRGVQKNDPTA